MEIYAIIQTRYGNNFFKYRIYDGKDEEQNIFYNMQFRSEARSSADVHNVDSYIPFYEWIMDEFHPLDSLERMTIKAEVYKLIGKGIKRIWVDAFSSYA